MIKYYKAIPANNVEYFKVNSGCPDTIIWDNDMNYINSVTEFKNRQLRIIEVTEDEWILNKVK